MSIDPVDLAKRMGAKLKGQVETPSGYLGALQTAANIDARQSTDRQVGYAAALKDVRDLLHILCEREHNATPDDRIGDGSVETLDVVLDMLREYGE